MPDEMEVCSRTGDHSKFGFTNVGTLVAPWWVCAKPGCLRPTRLYVERVELERRDV